MLHIQEEDSAQRDKDSMCVCESATGKQAE